MDGPLLGLKEFMLDIITIEGFSINKLTYRLYYNTTAGEHLEGQQVKHMGRLIQTLHPDADLYDEFPGYPYHRLQVLYDGHHVQNIFIK